MDFKNKLKEVIDTLKQGHCCGSFACSKDGKLFFSEEEILSDQAVAWCAAGACFKVAGSIKKGTPLMDEILSRLNLVNMAYWNDYHTEEVIPTLERIYNSWED